MFERVSAHLKDELGSDDVRMIFADTDGDRLILRSNRGGNGYGKIREGLYEKIYQLDRIGKNMEELRNKDTRFYGPTTWFGEQGYTLITVRNPTDFESQVLDSGTSYAFHRSDRLSRYLGREMTEFPDEAMIAHEGSHGIVSHIRNGILEDLFDEGNREDYVVDESVAVLVGLKFLERYLPEEVRRYEAFISEIETDSIHMEAFRLVLKERHRVEEMRSLIRDLVVNAR